MSSSRRASSAGEGPDRADDLQSLSDSVADELAEIEHDEDVPANLPSLTEKQTSPAQEPGEGGTELPQVQKDPPLGTGDGGLGRPGDPGPEEAADPEPLPKPAAPPSTGYGPEGAGGSRRSSRGPSATGAIEEPALEPPRDSFPQRTVERSDTLQRAREQGRVDPGLGAGGPPQPQSLMQQVPGARLQGPGMEEGFGGQLSVTGYDTSMLNSRAAVIQANYRGYKVRDSLRRSREAPALPPEPAPSTSRSPEPEPELQPPARKEPRPPPEEPPPIAPQLQPSNFMPPAGSRHPGDNVPVKHHGGVGGGEDTHEHAAAVKIQAHMRGSLSRKEVKKIREERERELEDQTARQKEYLQSRQTADRLAGRPVAELPEEVINPGEHNVYGDEASRSATKIQAVYRGHKARSSNPSPSKNARAPQEAEDDEDDSDDSPEEQGSGAHRRGRTLSRDLNRLRPPGIDVGPNPATETPLMTPKGLERLDYDPAEVEASGYGTGVVVKGRGSLRTSVVFDDAAKAGVAAWERFFRLHRRRVVPLASSGARRELLSSEFYRLRVVCAREIPMYVSADRLFEFQVNVTLFDELAGQFYGNTITSQIAPFEWINEKDPSEGVKVELDFDIYFHSTISDPGCIAVAEVVMVERLYTGIVAGQYSVGWAGLPLYSHEDGRPEGQQILETHWVDITAGSPRYLLFRDLFVGRNNEPPMPLGSARMAYQFTAYPLLLPVAPFVPPNCLVSYAAVVPGVQRFDQMGFLSTSAKYVTNTLAKPLLSPTFSVSVYSVAVALPAGFHELLTLEEPTPAMQCSPPQMSEYALRLSVHNGRCIVGPEVLSTQVRFVKTPSGGFVLEGDEAIELDWLPGDINTVLILELIYTGPAVVKPQMVGTAADNRSVVVGWAPVNPFTKISPLDGTQVNEGTFVVDLRSGPGYWVREIPLFDWRGMLEGRLRTAPPPLKMHFSLGVSGRNPILPPMAIMGETIKAPQGIATPPRAAVLCDEGDALDHDGLPVIRRTESPPPQPTEARPRTQGTEGFLMPDMTSVATSQQAMSLLSQQDRLTRLAETMQKQLDQMSTAITDLKKGRTSIHDFGTSETAASTGPTSRAAMDATRRATRKKRDAAATAIQRTFRMHRTKKHTAKRKNEMDIVRYQGMKNTEPGDGTRFAGGMTVPGMTLMRPPRWLRARLHEAGATDALPPEVRGLLYQKGGDDLLTGPVDMEIESRDPRLVSDVVFQLLAYRHSPALNAPSKLRNAYFTFQMYDFPPTISELARLKPSGEDESQVFFLQRHSQSVSADVYPGLLLKYCVDGSVSEAGPADVGNTMGSTGNTMGSTGRSTGSTGGLHSQSAAHARRMDFCRYLRGRSLSIDVWDGDSLLQIGTASLDLRPLLRQGRDFAEMLVEIPVVDHQEMAPDVFKRNRREGRPTASAPVARGFLMLRVMNIGRLLDPERLDSLASLPRKRHFESGSGSGRVNRVRVKAVPEKGGVVARELAVPEPEPPKGQRRRITEDEENRWMGENPHLLGPATMAWTDMGGSVEGPQMRQKLNDIEQRKIARQARLRELKANKRANGDDAKESPQAVREQLLVDIDTSRARVKRDVIRRQLWKHLSTHKAITPAFGEAVLFEHEVYNPQAAEIVLHATVSHPEELVVVRDAQEWKGLRVHCDHTSSGGGVSKGSSALESDVLDGDRLFLAGGERLVIPFKFQSYRPPSHMAEAHRAPLMEASGSPLRSSMRRTMAGPLTGSPEEAYTITVELRAEGEERPVSILELEVRPRGLVVDRTFRFNQPERERMRQVVRVPLLPGVSAALAGREPAYDDWPAPSSEAKQLVVACSDAEVVCGCQASQSGGENDEVVIKYKGGPAPETRQMFLALYRDRWSCRPLETWQVFIHSIKRVDLSAMVGQTCEGSVVVKGHGSSRRVRCYASHPDELTVVPDSFTLVGNALSEVRLLFRPVAPGKLDVLVHLVDTETRELVQALIVATSSQAPMISKTFEVELLAGTTLNKKISYTNPYQATRTFFLRTSHPWLVHFRPTRLELPSGSRRPVGLTFDGRGAPTGSEDVLIFVNDEEDKNEECFKIRLRVVDQ